MDFAPCGECQLTELHLRHVEIALVLRLEGHEPGPAGSSAGSSTTRRPA